MSPYRVDYRCTACGEHFRVFVGPRRLPMRGVECPACHRWTGNPTTRR